MLKTDLHLHTLEDPLDHFVPHSARDLIARAAKLDFKVLAITNHDYVHYTKALAQYAKKKGILLIPGAEVTIQGKHVLCYGIDNTDLRKIKHFDDLDRAPFVIAPHPYFFMDTCLGDLLLKHQKRFDAIEYSHFYSKYFNPNKKALHLAQKFHIPLVGNSDAHFPMQFNTTYSLIDAEPTQDDVFDAIHAFKSKVVSQPMSVPQLIRLFATFKYWDTRQKLGYSNKKQPKF